jgi:ferric-dicitrate binding protein FerR (iron transport regulator)
MNAEEYIILYEKYMSGNCSAEEEKLLHEFQDNFKVLTDDGPHSSPSERVYRDVIFERISETIARSNRKTIAFRSILKYAAVAILVAGIGFMAVDHYRFARPVAPARQTALQRSRPIEPGRATATLTLSDGSTVNLDTLKQGLITSAADLRIRKSAEGSIVYSATASPAAHNSFNTIQVPAGGTYNVILPDGTSVWLNSASSLTYPTNFRGKSRTVALKGEAYFEVAKNAAKPFIVDVNEMTVTVLGTHFNVNAYGKQATVRTTLLEGSVRLAHFAKEVVLRPGEQGTVTQKGSAMTVSKVNTNKVMGWKNGYFMFQDDSIEDIMEQIAMWYNVDVEYQGDMRNKLFGGIYSRNKDINELLKGLELTGLVHFKIEGRRIIVMA